MGDECKVGIGAVRDLIRAAGLDPADVSSFRFSATSSVVVFSCLSRNDLGSRYLTSEGEVARYDVSRTIDWDDK